MSAIAIARTVLILAVAAFASAASSAATFGDLHDFTASPDGREPLGSVTPMMDVLYGTTNGGGSMDAGTIYSIDPVTGEETVLYSFTGAFGGEGDGSAPVGEMVAVDGLLYGATSFGGAYNGGTVFSFDPATGKEAVVYSFGDAGDGSLPAAGLIRVGEALYGTTSQGGAAGLGTVFKLDIASHGETLLHEFTGGEDGAQPFAPVTFANGLLYGTTYFGGPANNGTVFSIDPSTQSEAILHAFEGPSFSGNPAAGLVYHHFNLYGTTAHGGRHCSGGCGTVFRVDTVTGRVRDLHRFSSPQDGEDPEGNLVLHQGVLYGTTAEGGGGKQGTVFAIDLASGAKTTLHEFKFPKGANPGNLVWFKGALYGTTRGGGGAAQGTVFKVTP